jgi:hypothetical protein
MNYPYLFVSMARFSREGDRFELNMDLVAIGKNDRL